MNNPACGEYIDEGVVELDALSRLGNGGIDAGKVPGIVVGTNGLPKIGANPIIPAGLGYGPFIIIGPFVIGPFITGPFICG